MNNKCKDCYIEVKKYTYLRGLGLSLFIPFFLMIPILNLFVARGLFGNLEDKNFWEDCWYDLKQVPVKNYKGR